MSPPARRPLPGWECRPRTPSVLRIEIFSAPVLLDRSLDAQEAP
jgi:hypothetical protein